MFMFAENNSIDKTYTLSTRWNNAERKYTFQDIGR